MRTRGRASLPAEFAAPCPALALEILERCRDSRRQKAEHDRRLAR